MARFWVLAVMAFSASGCATDGRVFDDSVTRDFVIGETTPDQAIAALGPPNLDLTRPDGLRLIRWHYNRVVLIAPFRRNVAANFRDGRLVYLHAPLKDEEVSVF